ncbi:MAG: replication initiator protein A [Pseudomonadota bacterium]
MALSCRFERTVLSLSRSYFRMRKPLDRRIWEPARKHCGGQSAWGVVVEVLHRKSGSASPRRVFRTMLRPCWHRRYMTWRGRSFRGRMSMPSRLTGWLGGAPTVASDCTSLIRGFWPGCAQAKT